MKIFRLISVLLAVVLMLSLFAGCNNKDNNDNTQPATTSVASSDAEDTTKATEATQQSADTTKSEATEPSYVQESDELEILGPSSGNDAGNETPDPVVTVPGVEEDSIPRYTETFPDMEDVFDEPIELPFVPID